MAAKIKKWKSAASDHKKETSRVREKGVGVITGNMDHLYKARLKQAKQKARIEELEEQVQLLKTDTEKMFSLAQQVMSCRPPTNRYALFLHEKLIFFCLESIYKEIWYEIEDPIQFFCILKIHDIIG